MSELDNPLRQAVFSPESLVTDADIVAVHDSVLQLASQDEETVKLFIKNLAGYIKDCAFGDGMDEANPQFLLVAAAKVSNLYWKSEVLKKTDPDQRFEFKAVHPFAKAALQALVEYPDNEIALQASHHIRSGYTSANLPSWGHTTELDKSGLLGEES